jgi:hypothetical protein
MLPFLTNNGFLRRYNSVSSLTNNIVVQTKNRMNLGSEEFGSSWVNGVLFSCQIEGELKKLGTCIMRN